MTTRQTDAGAVVPSGNLLADVQHLREECDAMTRLLPQALDRDGNARHAFKTMTEKLDAIIKANTSVCGSPLGASMQDSSVGSPSHKGDA
jgi:hypothetical protein